MFDDIRRFHCKRNHPTLFIGAILSLHSFCLSQRDGGTREREMERRETDGEWGRLQRHTWRDKELQRAAGTDRDNTPLWLTNEQSMYQSKCINIRTTQYAIQSIDLLYLTISLLGVGISSSPAVNIIMILVSWFNSIAIWYAVFSDT